MTLTASDLLEPSSLPFHFPDFAAISTPMLKEAMERAMTENEATFEAVSGSTEEPTFENTVAALDDSSVRFLHVAGIFSLLLMTEADDEMRDVEAWFAKRNAEHIARTQLNPQLAARVAAIIDGPEWANLSSAQQRLTTDMQTDLRLAGSYLSESDREVFTTNLGRLSELSAQFRAKLLAGANAAAVHVTDEAQLAGLPAEQVEQARATAAGKDVDGWLLKLVNTTIQPELSQLTDRETRARLLAASQARGIGGEHDTTECLLETVRLRAQQAALLGYGSHAERELSKRMAGTTKEVEDLLRTMAGPALKNLAAERDKLAAQAQAVGIDDFGAHDWLFFAEQNSDDEEEISPESFKPYLERSRVMEDGVFRAANLLYGLTFEPRPDLVGYSDDVQVVEVRDESGTPLGLVSLDFYARDSKQGGAWMTSLVAQSHRLRLRPVTTLNCNYRKPSSPDTPVLLTPDEVRTTFHEFGHVLHGLLSDVEFAGHAAPRVATDFVEYPSQVNEMWMSHPQVLGHYARHVETGEPMPEHLVAAFVQQSGVVTARSTVEMLAAVILDWEWHTLTPDQAAAVTSVVDFERDVLARWEIPVDVVPPRYRSSYFSHIFASMYSAGYYSYLWSEVLDADTTAWFMAQEDVRAAGKHFAECILSVGGSVDPMQAYIRLLGREPDLTPFLRRRQLVGEDA